MSNNNLVKIDDKTYDKLKFEPRSKRCVRVTKTGQVVKVCPLADVEKDTTTETEECPFKCKLFGYAVFVKLGRKQAVCSRRTKGEPFNLIIPEAEALAEAERQLQPIPKLK